RAGRPALPTYTDSVRASRIRTERSEGPSDGDKLPSLQLKGASAPTDTIGDQRRDRNGERDRVPDRHEPPVRPHDAIVQRASGREGDQQPQDAVGAEIRSSNGDRRRKCRRGRGPRETLRGNQSTAVSRWPRMSHGDRPPQLMSEKVGERRGSAF